MFKKTYLLIFASLFLTAKITIATSHDLNVQLLDIEKGLSHNTVYDLAQDHFGYMWIATQNGLNRYDGYTMTLIAENQQNELSKGFKGKCITAVFIDSRNNLWVGTRMGHINVKNSGQFNFSPLVDSALQKLLFSHEISRFYEDSEGNIWIATVGQGVLKYEFRTGNYSHYTNKKSNLSSNEAFDIIEINEQILVACGGGNLNLFSKKSELFVQTHEMRANSPNLSGYRKRLINANGYLWLGTEGTGLYRINKENFEFINYNLQPEKYGFYANVIRDILPVNDSTLLIASDGDGLYYLNTNTNEIRHIEKNDFGNRLLNSSSLTKIVFDKQQNIWIGSYNGGVNIIKNSAKVFQISSLIEDLNNLSEKSILSVAEFDDNKLLLGTDGAGLCLYDKNSGIIERIAECQNEKKHPPVIKDILQVADNEYLLACFSEGIYLYNAKTFCFEQLHSGINAWSINKGPKGNYWFGTLGNGIVKLDESYNWINQNIFPSAISVNIMDLAFDQSQNLLVGTGNEGLFKYNFKTKSLTNLSNKHATIGNEIRAISLLKNGHLLIGTEGSGVSIILNNDSVYSIDQEKGLLSNNAIGFYPHEKNSVWISSFRGVSKLTLSDYSIKNYSLNGVENSNQFNHNAILVNSSKLYMGGIYGLTIMNLKADLQPLDTFKTFISNINIQGLAYQSLYNITNATETTKEIQLSYNQNSFEFSFASAGLLESANRIYTYQLKGFNKRARQTAPGQNQVYYTNINPGTYTLDVGYNNKTTSITIVINGPFWQQWWFKSLVLLFIIGAIGFGFIYTISRQNQKHKQEILAYKNKELREELETKNTKLMYSAVQNAAKNEVLNELKAQLTVVKSQTENDGIKKVIKTVNRELKNENYWKTFNTYFNEVDQNFIHEFLQKHGELTQNDQRLVALIRLNLSTNEIASLLNISVRGVEQSKYRLKKKIGLEKELNLVLYIQKF